MWTMLPATLRSTPITKARTRLRCTMDALAKSCHELWVTRHRQNREVSPSRTSNVSGEKEDDIMSESNISWTENVFGETPLSQWSIDDKNTAMQQDEDPTQGEGELGEGNPNEEEEAENYNGKNKETREQKERR